MRKYGLTVEALDELKKKQQSKCAVCFSEEELHVDHDHETGSVRGLLCGRCNRGIGMFDDDADKLSAAVGYLLGRSPQRD